jgi:hypothetical protein
MKKTRERVKRGFLTTERCFEGRGSLSRENVSVIGIFSRDSLVSIDIEFE